MTDKFVEHNGVLYRILLQRGNSAWLISYQEPAAPLFTTDITADGLKRCPAPDDYIESSSTARTLSAAEKKRLAMIAPLLGDERNITSKTCRAETIKQIAAYNDTTAKRICRLYYRYLATGRLMLEKKSRRSDIHETYNWAIRELYFSSKRFSLRQAYEMMLIQRYSDKDGNLLPGAPTYGSFVHYFYRKKFHLSPSKIIGREGLTYYQRNERPTFGSSALWREKPGSFQIDATEADIFLVSRIDRETVIGRPNIYMAVDTATQLITGVYIGMEAGENAVMSCIAQSASDKVEYCKKYGIEIEPDQWPNHGLPEEIISDKGHEFTGHRMEELLKRFGITLQSLPPYRPDEKGLIEKSFDLLQMRYKPYLRGAGVIGKDAAERWAVDYRSQAVLDIDEFTKIVIHCIIYLNSGRVLSTGKTAAELWTESNPDLIDVPYRELRLLSLPRVSAKLTKRGFHINSLWYAPQSMAGLYLGESYTIAYDPDNLREVYVVNDSQYITCELAQYQKQYAARIVSEATAEQKKTKKVLSKRKHMETEASRTATKQIQTILEDALAKHPKAGRKRAKKEAIS